MLICYFLIALAQYFSLFIRYKPTTEAIVSVGGGTLHAKVLFRLKLDISWFDVLKFDVAQLTGRQFRAHSIDAKPGPQLETGGDAGTRADFQMPVVTTIH
jgi:hypothetical protein